MNGGTERARQGLDGIGRSTGRAWACDSTGCRCKSYHFEAALKSPGCDEAGDSEAGTVSSTGGFVNGAP